MVSEQWHYSAQAQAPSPVPEPEAPPTVTAAPTRHFIVNDNSISYHYEFTATNPGSGVTGKDLMTFNHFDVRNYGTNLVNIDCPTPWSRYLLGSDVCAPAAMLRDLALPFDESRFTQYSKYLSSRRPVAPCLSISQAAHSAECLPDQREVRTRLPAQS